MCDKNHIDKQLIYPFIVWMEISGRNFGKLIETLKKNPAQSAACVPMKHCLFRQFVRSGKNRHDINHEVVQKVVSRKIREPL